MPSGFRSCGSALSLMLLLLAAAFLAARPLSGQAVLNTERVEPQDVSGFFTSLEAGTNLQGGNSDVVELKGNGVIGYRGTHSWIELIGGLSYLSSSDSVSVEDRFAQVRYGWFFTKRTRTFHFVQIQNRRAQALAHRLLVGSGLRHSFAWSKRNRLDFGLGLMWESEKLDTAELPRPTRATSRDWRADLIGYGSHRLSSAATLTDVLYVEPRVDAPADIRILDEVRLALTVTKGVDVNLDLHWLHDSRPPPSIGPNDVQFETSLSATVK